MNDLLLGVGQSLKLMISDKMNRLTAIVVIGFCFLGYNQYCIEQKIDAGNKEVVKKVHFRYFNLTKSLEELFNVEINTRDGSIAKRHKG